MLLSIISLSYAVLEFKEYAEIPSEIDKEFNDTVTNSTTFSETTNKNLTEALNVPINLTRGLAAELSKEDLNTTELEAKLNYSIQNNPRIFGIGVAYEPGMYQYLDNNSTSDPDLSGLYSPSYYRRNGELELFNVFYNYTKPRINASDPHTEWYLRTMKEGEGWNEPYFGNRSKTYILEYSVPIERNGTRIGVVFSSYSKEGLRKLFNEMKYSGTGYFFVVSEGKVLYHPVPEYFNKDIGNLTENEDPELLYRIWTDINDSKVNASEATDTPSAFKSGNGQLIQQILNTKFNKSNTEVKDSSEKSLLHYLHYYSIHHFNSNKKIVKSINTPQDGNPSSATCLIFHDEFSNQDLLVIVNNISKPETTNLTIPNQNKTVNQSKTVIVFPIQEILDKQKESQEEIDIRFAMAILSFFLFFSLALITCFRYNSRGLWIASLIAMILFSAGIGYIWYLHSEGVSNGDISDDVVIYNREGMESLLEKTENPNTDRVTVGIFLKSIEFSSANEVIVTGYLWQKNTESTGKLFSGKEPVIFPEAKEFEFNQIYTDEKAMTWEFKAVLRQQFDYSSYPFDGEDVWIRLWPNNFNQSVVLIPDFDAYSTLDPAKKPGLEEHIPVEGWEIQKSYFSYKAKNYTTNFGIPNYRGLKDYTCNNSSELYFNVEMRRDLMSPIVSNLLPFLVVAILLFVVLIITTKDEEKSLFGFSSSGVLSYCASLFFTLIVAHASIRSNLPTEGAIYVEDFYFVMYFAILAVSLNSIAFASHVNIPFIDAKDNMYVKVLYWPAVMGVLLLITLMSFY